MDGSSRDEKRKSEFVGAHVKPDTKRRVERRAESEGESISEVVRRQLDGVNAESQ